jgi:hypothetical protein
MKTNTAETERAPGGKQANSKATWATLVVVIVAAAFGVGGCADYYGAYPAPAYNGGYYASTGYYGTGGGYYGPGVGYGAPYGYGGYPYYGAPYGYGGTSISITSERYRGRDGRWYYRHHNHPRQQTQNTTQVHNTGSVRNSGTVRVNRQGRAVRPTDDANRPQPVSQPLRQP